MLRAVQGAADHRSDTDATAPDTDAADADPNTDADVAAAGGRASPREASDACPSHADAPLSGLSGISADKVGPD